MQKIGKEYLFHSLKSKVVGLERKHYLTYSLRD